MEECFSIFEPSADAGVPFQGLVTAAHPSALPDGIFSKCQNLRPNSRTLKVRDGSAKLTGSDVPSTASARGVFSGYLNGTLYLITALRKSSATQIHSFNASTFAYIAEITSSATRFSTDGDVIFAPVRDTVTGRDVLIMQNGTDTPRVYDPVAGTVSLHAEMNQVPISFITATRGLGESGVGILQAESGDFFFSDSGGGATITKPGGAQDTVGTLEFDNSTVAGDYADVHQFPAQSMEDAEQLVIFYKAASGVENIWPNVKIELVDGAGNAKTIWNSTETPILKQDTFPGWEDYDPQWMALFSFDGVDKTSTSITAWRRIRFTWTGGSTSGVEIGLIFIWASGVARDNSRYAATYVNSIGRSETYPIFQGGVIAPVPAPISQYAGGSIGGELSSGRPLPTNPNLFVNYAIGFTNTNTTDRDAGWDTFRVYRKEPGESAFFFAFDVALATYSGSWSFTSGTALSPRTATDTVLSNDRDRTRTPPSAGQLPIPIGNVMLAESGRLFVGDVTIGGVRARGDLYISKEFDPFRFDSAYANLNDLTAPTRISLKAGETVKALSRVASTWITADTIFVFSNLTQSTLDSRNSFELSKPAYRGPHGVAEHGLVANYADSMFWVDQERQLRFGGPTMKSPSLNIVDDILKTGTFASSRCQFWNGRLYIPYIPSGGTTYNRILIFDTYVGAFYEDKLGAGEAKYLFLHEISGVASLCYLSANGDIYQHEKAGQTTDAGTGIPVELATRFYRYPSRGDQFNWINIRRIAVMSSSDSGSLDVTIDYLPNQAAGESSISLDSSPLGWTTRYDDGQDLGGNEGAGELAKVTLSGDLAGGTEILKIVGVREHRESRWDQE